MKEQLLFALVFLFITIAAASDLNNGDSSKVKYDLLNAVETDRVVRQRRTTCELISIKGLTGYNICDVHCITRGKRGGYCKNGICHCRSKKN